MVAPSCTGERPRASGVSGGQARQAFTRGSPRSRMRTCSSAGPARIRAEPWGSCRLGEGSLRPQPRARTTKDTGNAGLFPLRRASFTACPALPCSAHAHPPAFHSFANASGGRRLVQDGRKGAWADKRYERGRPCSAVLLRGAPVPPVIRWARPCAGEGRPRRTHASSTALETVRHAVSGAPTASPRQLPARGVPCLLGRVGGLLWAGGRLAPCPRSVRPAPCADQGRLSVSRQDSGPSERPPRFPER